MAMTETEWQEVLASVTRSPGNSQRHLIVLLVLKWTVVLLVFCSLVWNAAVGLLSIRQALYSLTAARQSDNRTHVASRTR
jgi:hypothetical protein